jgi:hypothetical protein
VKPNLQIISRVNTFSSFQDKRNSIPSFVLDVSDHGAESRAARILWYCIILLVCWLAAVQRFSILTNDDIFWLYYRNASEDSHLLSSQIFFITTKSGNCTFSSRISSAEKEIGRSIASRVSTWSRSTEISKSVHQKEMYLRFCITSRMIPNSSKYPPRPSVPKGSLNDIYPRLSAPFLKCKRLIRSPYLDVIDMIPVPCCSKELVSETQNEDVLHHLLSKVMVDTENLIFSPIWLKRLVQFSRAW